VRSESYHLETGRLGTGGIGRVRENGGNDFVSLSGSPTRRVVGADDRGVGVDRLRSGRRLQGKAGHARNLFEHVLETIHNLQDALNRFFSLQRVQLGQPGVAGQLIVDLGAILHSTRPLANLDIHIRP
jgi:hypothetical protein